MEQTDRSNLIDLEPFSTLLVALGALDSIASLYALIEPRRTQAKLEREANRYAIRDALMGAETGLNELRGYIRSLEIAFAAGTQTRSHSDPRMLIAQFGQVSLNFTGEGHERWREIEEGILTTVARIQRHMGNLMRHFAATNLKLEPDTARRLQGAVEKLNNVVRSLVQVHFGELFRSVEEAAGECMDTLRQLRFDLGGFIG
ncbi:MAG: hypothetical protein WA624_23725 [Methylocella sp.]